MEGNYYTELIEFNATIIMNWVTLFVLFLILKHFFFEKVYNFLVAREHAIQDAYDNAEIANNKAEKKLEAYQKRIAEVETEGREIIKKAREKADKQASDIIEEANRKAHELRLRAESEIEREKAQAIIEVKNQIAMYAVMAAEKILEKEIKIEGQDAFIDKIIEQAGTTGWRN